MRKKGGTRFDSFGRVPPLEPLTSPGKAGTGHANNHLFMPLIHVHSPVGTFSDTTRDALAEELTVIALESENLPMTPFDKSTTWIYFHELPPDRVYHGGQPGGTRVISLEVNAFEGGLEEAAKRSLYARFTQAIRHRAGIAADVRAPVYIVLREINPVNWGVFGSTTNIEELRVAHPEESPI